MERASPLILAGSPASLLGRVAITLAVLLLAVVAGISALAVAWREGAPDRVLRIIPSDAAARLVAIESTMRAGAEQVDGAVAAGYARAALADDPLNPRALRVLATLADSAGQAARAEALLGASERVTRRELLTQLILIEFAVQRGQIGRALAHYDRALSVHPESGALLYPVLGRAIADPAIRRGLLPYVEADRPWIPGFLSQTIDSTSGGAASVAAMVPALGAQRRRAVVEAVGPALIDHLIGSAQFGMLQQVLTALDLTAVPVDGALNQRTIDRRLGQLAWARAPESDASVSLDAGSADRSVSVDLQLPPAFRGVVLRRVVALRPGRYTVIDRRAPPTLANDVRLDWQMSCLGGGAPVPFWQSPDNAAGTGGRYAGPIVPAARCAWQRIELVARSGDQNGDAGIDNFAMLIEK